MKGKLWNYCLRESRKSIKFAKSKIKDKKWLRGASEISRDMVQHDANTPLKKLAKERCDELTHRACAKVERFGFIDPATRAKYKRIVGRNPSCK